MKSLCSMMMIMVMLTVSACGDTPAQRAVTGGAIGIGAGAVAGALVGGSVLGAAALGGAAGAVVGAVTKKEQLDLHW